MVASAFGSRIAIGAPWFGTVVVPLLLIGCGLAAIFPFAVWRGGMRASARRALAVVGIAIVVGAAMGAVFFLANPIARAAGGGVFGIAAGLGCALGLLASAAVQLGQNVRAIRGGGQPLQPLHLGGMARRVLAGGRHGWGMVGGHLGLGVVVLGISLAEGFTESRTFVMTPDVPVEFADGTLVLRGERFARAENYLVREVQLHFAADRDSGRVVVLNPALHLYPPPRATVTTEAFVSSNGWRDLYAVLGDDRFDEETKPTGVLIQLHHRPGIPLIWFGVFLGVLGIVVSTLDRVIPRSSRASRMEGVGVV